MQDEHNTDLDWQAFRYVAGEMTEGEFDRFEEQLALDQSAREAVAEAAHLAQTIALTESQQPLTLRPAVAAGSGKRLAQTAVWMGFGAAVCLAIMVSAGWLDFSADAPVASRGSSRDGSQHPAMADDEATRLAISWIETKDVLTDQTNDAQDSLIDLLGAVEDEVIALEMTGADDIEAETPSWLLLAVLEEQGELAPEEN